MSTYRADIDGLRAIAVAAVVAYHAWPQHFSSGFLGVDVFFVLSGYLISTLVFEEVASGRFRFTDFYQRRIRRILPALTLVLVVTLLVGWWVLFADEFKRTARHVIASTAFLTNFALLKESNYFDVASESKPLLHLWSLAIEEQFYLFFPVLVVLLRKRPKLLDISIVGLTITSFAVCLWLGTESQARAFYLTPSRIWEIGAGVCLARHQHKVSALLHGIAGRSWGISTLALCGLGGLVISLSNLGKSADFPGVLSLVPVLSTVVLIACGAHSNPVSKSLGNPLLVWLGKISYPLYLWHWPILSYSRIIEVEPLGTLHLAGLIALSVVLADLTYRLLETPIRTRWHSLQQCTPLLGAFIVSGCAAGIVFLNAGVPTRPLNRQFDPLAFSVPGVESCQSLRPTTAGDDYCHVSEGGTRPGVVIIGDSQSNSFAAILSALPASSRPAFLQFARGSCPMLIDFGPPPCRELARLAYQFVDRQPTVKTIVIAARWPLYQDQPELKAAFLRTIALYRTADRRVLLVDSLPLARDPRQCLPRPLRLVELNECSMPRDRENQFSSRASAELAAWAESVALRDRIDPRRYLCNDQACLGIQEGKRLYADETHLSVYGARHLATVAGADILSLLR